MPLGLEAVSNLRDMIGTLRSQGYGWEWEAWMPKIPSSLEGRMAFDGRNLYIVAGLYTIEVREQKTLNMTKYEPIMKSGAWFIYSIAVTLEELREPYTGITITTPTYTTPIYTPSTMTTHEYSTPPATYETPAFGRYERSTRGAEVSFSTSLALAVAIAALITIIVVVATFAIKMKR
jgi:hypothetical protein